MIIIIPVIVAIYNLGLSYKLILIKHVFASCGSRGCWMTDYFGNGILGGSVRNIAAMYADMPVAISYKML